MEGDQLEDLGVDRRIISKSFSRNRMGTWTRLIWLRLWTDGGLL